MRERKDFRDDIHLESLLFDSVTVTFHIKQGD